MDELKPIVFCNLFRDKKRFACDSIDGFVGFDCSEARVLVTRVAKAADKKPFHRIALQFETQRGVGRRSFLQFLECAAIRKQAFDNATGDAASFFADAIAEFGNAWSIGAARTVDGFG